MARNALVVGMPRSGTSMTTQIFTRCGYFVAENETRDLRDGDEFNPGGYWEAAPLINANAEILNLAGYSYDNTWMYEPITKQQSANIAQVTPLEKHRALLNEYEQQSPWVWKDPRLCYTIGYWSKLINWDTTGVLFLKRTPEDIYQSFLRLKWREHSNASQADVFERIVNHLEYAEYILKSEGVPYIEVDYSQYDSEPEKVVSKINNFFDLSIDQSFLGYDKKLNRTGLKGRVSIMFDRFIEAIPSPIRRGIKLLVPKRLINFVFPYRT